MSNKRSHCGNAYGVVRGHGYQSLIAIILALSVVVTLVVAEVNTKNKSDKASTEVSVMSLSASSPSKEYVYAGARLIATEECSLSISPASASFPATMPPSGGSQFSSFAVTAPAGCSWTATNNTPSFLTITSGSGTGNGTVSYSVMPNTGSTIRNGTISVKDQTFTVYQGISFLDVPTNDVFYTEIGKLAARGVTLGCGGGNYCPNDPVTRDQMSAFILRAKGEFNPPNPASQRFNDVPPQNVFYNFIDRMAVLQITLGCSANPPLYCPSDAVQRQSMAAFIIRALGELSPPPPPTQRFNDVPPSNPFYNFIDRMAVLNITLGCSPNPPMYCPTDVVTRAQMAAFLVRAFSL